MSSAYVKDILPNSQETSQGSLLGVHQTSPAWVLTFVRWQSRVPSRDGANLNLSVREPLVVVNDCVSVSTAWEKGSHTPAMQAMLKLGDIDYMTALAPGDFVFVNMLDSPEEAIRVAQSAKKARSINHEHDGFKGFYRVQSVRKLIQVDPGTGIKTTSVQIQGYAFTEFNNVIYFNPYLITEAQKSNDFLFLTNLSTAWQQSVVNKPNNTVQYIVKLLVQFFIGNGPNAESSQIKDFSNLKITQNTHFYMPREVGSLMGLSRVESAKDVYIYLFGVQKYQAGSEATELAEGMNPVIKNIDGRFYDTGNPCQGYAWVKAEFWNQVSAWSIINQYLNAPINEIYNCFRLDRNGRILPTMVMRQMPFSSEKYSGTATKFLNLPRWRISPDLIYSINLGRDEAARTNFVQLFGRNLALANPELGITQQISQGNFDVDIEDVRKHGLRPIVFNSNFDLNFAEKSITLAPTWAKLMGDAIIGSHLKVSGSITCAGIVEPIAVGDNLELDGIVYHIESITHMASVTGNGEKTFKTTLSLSHGVDIRSTAAGTQYAYMSNVTAKSENDRDYERERLLPGISDSQYSLSKDGSVKTNPDISKSKNEAFASVDRYPANSTTKDKKKKAAKATNTKKKVDR